MKSQAINAVKHSGLPTKIVERLGRRLKDLLTDSRPLDKAKCTNNNCRTRTGLDKGDCTSRNTIYKTTCWTTAQRYMGAKHIVH